MVTTTSTDCDSTPNELRNAVENLQSKSKPNATKGRAKAGTKKAVKTPKDSEVRLSILQAAFDQYLEAGGRAGMSGNVNPIIQLYGVSICGNCRLWTLEKECPVCANPGCLSQMAENMEVKG